MRGRISVFSSPDWDQVYAYDRYGNRTSVTKTGGGTNIPLDGLTSLTFTNGSGQTLNNRITTTGYTYDDAGNLTRGQTDGGLWQRYKYDSAGRLAEVMDDSWNLLESNSYGASNQRLKSQQGTLIKYYGWDGGQVIAEYDAVGASDLRARATYVYLGGRLLATVGNEANGSDADVRFHHPDRLGSRISTDSSNGELVTEQMGMPYGTQQPDNGFGGDGTWQHTSKPNPSRQRFTSYDRSASTGLDYAVNRYYSAAQGRFTQVDPIGMSAASLNDPQTLNLYTYCGNDPINHTDPDGLLFGWLKSVFSAIGKVFSAVARAILRVLDNKWVSLGFTILGATVGLIGAQGIFKLLSKAATKVLSAAINYYNKAKDIAGMLSLAGKALQGQFKEIGLALAGSLPAIIEDSILREVTNVFNSPQKFSLGAYLKAVGDGFKHGYARLKEVFSRQGWRRFIPVYGFFCGSGYGDSALASGIEGVDGVDGTAKTGGCREHDQEYADTEYDPNLKKRNLARLSADEHLLGDFFTQTTKGHLIDRALGVSVGQGYRVVGIPAIGGLIGYRSAYDKLKK